ncbi:Fructokinase [Hexamita inflata]|uniref:Fructokinase n=1 Tax=Hexamita inflata TaxID=28002 RepID=A0AA86RAU2_9EUKA|nr:Fructokinase [Hexamita inflata]
MSRVFSLGTMILDVMFENYQAKNSNPGGAIFNTSVSLNRMNVDTNFITVIGEDEVGKIFLNFCEQENMKQDNIVSQNGLQSMVALAFLQKSHSTNYEFFGEIPYQALADAIPPMRSTDIFLFGDFFSSRSEFAPVLQQIQCTPILYFDPNVRGAIGPLFWDCVSKCDILRLSADDLISLGLSFAQLCGKAQNKIIIVTDIESVQFYLNNTFHTLQISKITPVCTIGAGDNFNAGFLKKLSTLGLERATVGSITAEQLQDCILFGIKCAQKVCMLFENFVPREFE